jgi:hypothetical protein
MTTVVLYAPKWTDIIPADLSKGIVAQVLKGREVDGTLGLGLGIAGVFFTHLLFL